LVIGARVEAPTPGDAHLLAKEYIKQVYRSLADQGLIGVSDFASLVAYARSDGELEGLPRELRPKNAYNLLRLLFTSLEWLRSGEPAFRLDEPIRSRLAAIKRGEVPLDEVLAEANALTPELEEARQRTRLPERADLARADALLRRLRTESARRSLDRQSGPWGAEAAPPPGLTWEDET
jgi:hypothetical protein